MKSINNYIIEKFKLNSKNMPTYSFKHIDKKDIKPFWGYNWILNSDYFNNAKILLEYALNNLILSDNEEKFIEEFYKDIKDYENHPSRKTTEDYQQKTEILNGKRNNGYYQRPKCLYDICKYIDNEKDFDNNSLKGKLKDEDIACLIFDLKNLTNEDINNLDWAYNEKD